MNVGIRDALAADVDRLGLVHVRAWQAAYRGVMPDAYPDGLEVGDRVAMWARFLEVPQPARRLLVVTVDDRVVGFACSKLVSAFEKSLAIAIVVSATLFAPILAVGMYLLLGDVFPVIARYAMPLLPAFFVAAALMIRNRAAEWAVVAYGGFLVVAVTTTAVVFA